MEQARLVEKEGGLVPEGEGWFVVNARRAEWWANDALGYYCPFEGEGPAGFAALAFNLRVLAPGQPNCMYHAEPLQEDFLVLSGECLLLIEGEERRLGPWDFVHCPPWAEHVFVGAGEGPCVLLCAGSRPEGAIRFPVAEVALRHHAGVERATEDGDEAYAPFPDSRRAPCPDGVLG